MVANEPEKRDDRATLDKAERKRARDRETREKGRRTRRETTKDEGMDNRRMPEGRANVSAGVPGLYGERHDTGINVPPYRYRYNMQMPSHTRTTAES